LGFKYTVRNIGTTYRCITELLPQQHTLHPLAWSHSQTSLFGWNPGWHSLQKTELVRCKIHSKVALVGHTMIVGASGCYLKAWHHCELLVGSKTCRLTHWECLSRYSDRLFCSSLKKAKDYILQRACSTIRAPSKTAGRRAKAMTTASYLDCKHELETYTTTGICFTCIDNDQLASYRDITAQLLI
jgi:hypothetical protein